MHRSLLPLAVAFAGVLAAPQSSGLEGLSTCVQTAALTAVGATNCALTDVTCLCATSAFQDALRAAIADACGPEDVAATEDVGKAFCANNGSPVPDDSGSDASPSGSETTDAGEAGTTEAPDASPSEGGTAEPISAGGNTTVWVNGTCPHHCPEGEGPKNGTAPMPSPPVPGEPEATGSNGTGPLYTGAASTLVGSAFSAMALAAAFALL